MMRRSPVIDRVGRDVANRDSRRRVGEILAEASRHETLLKNLLWILERADDPEEEAIDTKTRQVLGRLVTDLRNSELLALLVEDSSLLHKYCRCCGRDLKQFKQSGRGRPLEYCRPACRQKAYRRRINPNVKSEPMTMWLADMLQDTVEQMAQAESVELQQLILRSQMEKIERRQGRGGARSAQASISSRKASWYPSKLKADD
ncbi:hypothetical protein [Nocardia amamiensis]|uniref:hypothetical protein n=1 Tax=Nocardia amamiensis TaxID=404578 RepID=UPI0033D60038